MTCKLLIAPGLRRARHSLTSVSILLPACAQQGLDIGPKSIDLLKDTLKGAKTVIWNGPMGVFEVRCSWGLGSCRACSGLQPCLAWAEQLTLSVPSAAQRVPGSCGLVHSVP